MFGNMLSMLGNYESRKVGRWNSEDGTRMVSTCSISDGKHPFETAFQHEDYNNGEMIIVEAYDTKESAKNGHDKWVTIMTEGQLPDELVDCCNSEASKLAIRFGNPAVFKRTKKK